MSTEINEAAIKEQIAELQKQLTGNLFADGELHDEIYTLKKQLNPRIVEHPEEDDFECIACGS